MDVSYLMCLSPSELFSVIRSLFRLSQWEPFGAGLSPADVTLGALVALWLPAGQCCRCPWYMLLSWTSRSVSHCSPFLLSVLRVRSHCPRPHGFCSEGQSLALGVDVSVVRQIALLCCLYTGRFFRDYFLG